MDYGCQSMVTRLERVLVKHPRDAFISQQHLQQEWQRYHYVACPDYERALAEYEALLSLLDQHVPTIDFLPHSEDGGLDSLYTHDPVKFTHDGAILLHPAKVLRQREPSAMRAYCEREGIPLLGAITGDGRMEGGDVVWLDEHTVALGRGYRTNDEGIRQFRQITEGTVDKVIVVPLPHAGGPDECLHLMSVISLVDHDLAVVYSSFLPVFFREWLLDHGIRLVEVPDEEYDNLGCNVLALAPRRCLVLAGNPRTRRQLEAAGTEVIEYEGREISFQGTGGPTCLTAPVRRA